VGLAQNPLITVIGRGHSGTRAISHTLSASGVFMGGELNKSGDLVPPEEMYEACRVMARYVDFKGGFEWDFSRLSTMPVDPAFTRLVESYLASVLSSDCAWRGWKIPETTLVFPWISRLFPDNRYIYWIRDPRDAILGRHITDDLARFDIPHEPSDDVFMQRIASCKYQYAIVEATPRPRRFMSVRFEDFVLAQDETLEQVGSFLGLPLSKIEVRPDSVGRWKDARAPVDWDLFNVELEEFGYD
jgi:hypothetical protein